MKIIFNSKEIEIRDGITVEELKYQLNIRTKGIAVAVNGKIVVASRHSEFKLNEGDDVILIGAAYGG